MTDAGRRWVSFRDIDTRDGEFEAIRRAFVASAPSGDATWREGRVGYGDARLLDARALVDFGVRWIGEHRV